MCQANRPSRPVKSDQLDESDDGLDMYAQHVVAVNQSAYNVRTKSDIHI